MGEAALKIGICYMEADRCNDCPADHPSKSCPEYKKPSLNPALRPFWETKGDLKILKGGRISSKTWDAAGFAVFLANNYKIKFLCVRQFQSKIAESVYAVLKVQIERFGLTKEFDIQKAVIRHYRTGSEFHFYGIHRNIAEIKGFEGAQILWIEESEGLTTEQWEVIEPTYIRNEGAECWLVYNPRLETDFVETNPLFKHDPANGVIVRHINYDENPWMSETALRKINALKLSDPDEHEHIYLGVPRSSDNEAIIKRSWVMAAIDAHKKLNIEISGGKELGFDVADDGPDLNSMIYRHGIVALWGENWKGKEDELLKSCKRVYRKAIGLGAVVKYDSIGVGAHAGAKFKELNEANDTKLKYHKYNAGSKVILPKKAYVGMGAEKILNKDFFENLVAQSWWNIADRFRNTYNAITNGEKFKTEDLISISSDMPNLASLVTQLSSPKRDYSKDGKVKRENKDDMKKRGIDSPNDADAFIMAYFSTNKSLAVWESLL